MYKLHDYIYNILQRLISGKFHHTLSSTSKSMSFISWLLGCFFFAYVIVFSYSLYTNSTHDYISAPDNLVLHDNL